MATVYSLLCWGGDTGLSVTASSSTDLITYNGHGVRASGTGVQFISGTLPTVAGTALALDTTYYAKWISYSTFELYYDSGLTSKINFTSAGSSLVMRGALYAAHNLSGALARYTNASVVCAFHTLDAAHSYWNSTGVSSSDDHVWECDEAYDAITTSGVNVTIAPQSLRITTMINGMRSSRAFHAGVYGAGFAVMGHAGSTITAITSNIYRFSVDGFTITHDSNGAGSPNGIALYYGNKCDNMIFQGRGKATSGVGINMASNSTLCVVRNNLVLDWATGIRGTQFVKGMYVAGNTVSNCTNGMAFTATSSCGGFWYNNISLGNTTNWQATYTGIEGASNNAGLSGEAWIAGSGTRITMATTDFASYSATSSAADFTPAASTSPQVDAGIVYFDPLAYDLAGDERPNYNNGGAEAYDVGCYEFDAGYGTHPASQTYTVSGVTLGRIKIAKQSDGTEIYNDTTLPSAEASTFGTNTPVYIYIRKGSAAPYFHPLKLSATIDVEGGLDYDATGLQQEDSAAHDYSATAVATDWSFNLATGAITHDSGTTRYSVQDLYSWHQDYTDGSTQIDDDPLMHGTTPTIFELINGGDISDADLQDLYGGSIEFEDGTLWANIWTTDTMAAAHDVYLVQDEAKITQFWASGPIDVLVKVNDAGTLIDSGLVDVYARPYGYSYAYYQVDASGGGRNVAPISTLVDVPTTTISSATAATYSDVTFTFGSTSQDLGEGGGAATYYCRIDCAGRTLDQVFARCQYVTRDVSTATLNSLEGWRYRKAHSSYTANNQYPFGRYAAGFWSVAQGVWLDNVASADQYSYQLTDHAGTTHQLALPLNQSVSLSGLDATWRVQLYDTAAAEELYNDVPGATTLLWEDPLAPAADRPIRLRVMSTTNGDGSAIEMIDATIGTCGTTESTIALSYLVAASEDTVDTANGIDGSTITGITINDGAMILEIDSGTVTSIGGVDVVQVDLKTLYAFETFWLGTEEGIRDEARFINAIDAANYEFVDFKIRNDTGYPVVIVGGYARDAATNSSASLTDYAGGAIHYAPDHVVNNVVTVGGSNIITGDVADVLAAIGAASGGGGITLGQFIALQDD